MNKRKKSGKFIMALGVLLILSSLMLVLYNTVNEKRAEKLSALVLDELDMDNIIPSAPADEVTPPDYIVNPHMLLPKKTIDGKDYVGEISIPALNIKLPVISQWSYENFKIAPCVYEGTPYMGNFIIAAHNYRKHFGALSSLEAGDKISFKDMKGNLFNYKVLFTEILDNTDIEEMSSGDWDLTLFTCTYGGATRITLRCELVE